MTKQLGICQVCKEQGLGDVMMVIRTGDKGAQFMGCPNFPTCRNTLKMGQPIVQPPVVAQPQYPEEVVVQKIPAAPKPKANGTSFYTAYAKDIFVALRLESVEMKVSDTMFLAIELVKQAKEAFE